MRVSYRWLRELLPDLTESPDSVAARLSAAGLAVDAITRRSAGLGSVVVASVEAIEPHPERSGLRLVTVRHAARSERVVCGASNVPEPGGLVVLAPIGTTLPNGLTLTARAIGGVVSEGMLCSETELGLAESSEGILVLAPGSSEPGTRFLDACPEADDTIFELDLTPNRPDALGHLGVARELAALLELPFAPGDPGPANSEVDERAERYISVTNHDLERCPHYGAAVALDITVAASPNWLRWRLHALGMRPVSNIVDVTNLLLFLYGQPLHAFDLDRVSKSEIQIRRARNKEPFTTLDGVARELHDDDLVICDGERPTALAGVMGGADSEIRETTRRVLIECAYFVPSGVRRAARRHGLHTESSHRFERGVDWSQVPLVLRHAKKLISDLGNGLAVKGEVHVKAPDPELPLITLRSRRLDQLLGKSVAFEPALQVLGRLGFHVESVTEGEAGKLATVRGAAFRPDVRREVDLIEEVARTSGLDAIPTVLPAIARQAPRAAPNLERHISEHAVALGLSEALTYAFTSPSELEKLRAPKASVELKNPLSEERSVMRTSLLPGLLEAVRRARRHGETNVKLFTVGSRFLAPPGGESLPVECSSFALALAGERQAYLEPNPDPVDVFDVLGIAQELVYRTCRQRLEISQASAAEATPHLHPRGAATLRVRSQVVGCLGPLHPDVVDALELAGPVQIVELDLAQLARAGRPVPQYRPIPKMPAVLRDLSLVVPDAVTAGAVESVIARAAGDLGESVRLLALFRGGSVPEGKCSLTFRIVYRDPGAAGDAARTLTDKEVDTRHQLVVDSAEQEFGAVLRS